MGLLIIDGEIGIPRSFTFDELRRLPQQVSERAEGLGRRTIAGVRLAALVEPLRVRSWARFALVFGANGYAANIPVERIERCTLVYAIDTQPLWAELGGPIRLVADGLGRHADVFAVTRISLSILPATIDHPFEHERARAVAARFRI